MSLARRNGIGLGVKAWRHLRVTPELSENSFFDVIHPDDRPRVLASIQANSNIPYELEYRIVRPDCSVRWIRDRAFAVRDAAGLVIRTAGVAEDVTEKRQLETQLRQSQKMQAIGRRSVGRGSGTRF